MPKDSSEEEITSIGDQAGYIGAFTRAQADGAMPNGTKVRKAWSEPGDGTPTGTEGVVLGSLYVDPAKAGAPGDGYLYFVEWDNRPKVAVGVIGVKVERAAREVGHA